MDKKQILQPFFVLRGKGTSRNCEIKKYFGGSQNETNTKHAEKQQQKVGFRNRAFTPARSGNRLRRLHDVQVH